MCPTAAECDAAAKLAAATVSLQATYTLHLQVIIRHRRQFCVAAAAAKLGLQPFTLTVGLNVIAHHSVSDIRLIESRDCRPYIGCFVSLYTYLTRCVVLFKRSNLKLLN